MKEVSGGDSRLFQASLKNVSYVIHYQVVVISGKLEGSAKKVLRVFQGNFRASLAFLKCFNEVSRVFQKSVVVVWHSSQLPEQKEGLFFHCMNLFIF